MKKKLFWLLLLATLITACAGTNPLSNTNWELLSYGNIDTPTSALPDGAATISFDAEGIISGNLGCNQFSGDYKVSGDTLKTGTLWATAMACLDVARMEQETTAMMLLHGTLTFKLDGETLTLFSEDGKSSLTLLRAE